MQWEPGEPGVGGEEGSLSFMFVVSLCGSGYRDYPGIISHSPGFTDIGPDQTIISDKGSSTSQSQDQLPSAWLSAFKLTEGRKGIFYHFR